MIVGPLAIHGHDAGTLCCNQAVDAGHIIAFSRQDDGRDATVDLAPTMRVGTSPGPRAASAGNLAIAGALKAKRGGPDDNDAQAGHLIAARPTGRGYWNDDGLAGLRAHPGGQAENIIVDPQLGVRRLTPTECERLQGFPDGHTAVNGMSDSARYRMLGNAVAVPVLEWVGQRIMVVETECAESNRINS